MEIAVSIVVIAVSLCLILLLYFQKSRRDSYGDYLSLSGVLLGLWFISCSVFNTYFFSFRFAGLFDLSVERVLLCALVLIMLLRIYRGQAAHGIDYSILLLIFLFSLTCVISMSVNGFEAITPEYPKPWFVFFSGYMIPFFVYLFVVMIIKSESEIYFIFTCLFLFGVYLTITAFLEHYNLKFLVFPQYITSKLYPLHLDRARGPFLNSAFDGLAINQGFLAGLYLLNSSKTRFKSIIVILMLLFPPALFFCRTRSAYLIFLFILAGCFFVFKTRFVK